MRVTFILTHPVQYYCGWCKRLACRGELEFLVLYAFRQEQLFDYGFRQSYSWDIGLYDGYRYEIGPAWVPFRAKLNWWPLIFPKALVAAFRADAVILNGFTNATAILILLTRPLHRACVLVRNDAAEFSISRRGLKGWFKRSAYRFFLMGAARALVQGRQNADYFTFYGVPRDRQAFVPVSVLDELFNSSPLPEEERSSVRMRYQAERSSCVFIYSGKLESRKRVGRIVEAFATHVRFSPNSRLWIVGSGEMDLALRQQVEGLQITEAVVFVGFKLQREMAMLYKAADVQVHAARNDPWPVALLEGARCGLPQLIARSVGSCEDLVDENRTGFAFDANKLEALVSAMDRMAASRSLRAAMRANILRHTSGFNEAASIDALVNCVTESVGAKRR